MHAFRYEITFQWTGTSSIDVIRHGLHSFALLSSLFLNKLLYTKVAHCFEIRNSPVIRSNKSPVRNQRKQEPINE